MSLYLLVVRASDKWKCYCPTHEIWHLHGSSTKIPILDGVRILDHYDGSNEDIKYRRDIGLLTIGTNDPVLPNWCRARCLFYLANSYYAVKRWYDSRLIYCRYREHLVTILSWWISSCNNTMVIIVILL